MAARTGGKPGSGDEAARGAIRTDLDATLFVEAGAGSGKTTSLVERILGLVASGRARLSQIAAITFTEAAAAELRERVFEGLEKAAAAPAAGGRPTGETAESSALFLAALEEVDVTAIGTLHGFARRLLAEHPFEAGLPPTFEVFDDVRSGVAFEERWQEILDELLEGPAYAMAMARALVCGVREEHLRKLAKVANQNWDLMAYGREVAHAPVPLDVELILAPLREACALAGLCSDPEDRLLEHLGSLEAWAARLAEAMSAGEHETLRYLARSKKLSAGNSGKAPSWGGRKADVLALLTQAESARSGLVQAVLQDALVHVFDAICELTAGAAERRRREGRLEFHDLLVLARDLLRHHDDVASDVGRQFPYLLIDEFQDTDPIQAELAVRIAGSTDPREDWREMTVAPGRLFFVGDPKQSIYRFRRADIAQFMEVRRRLAEEPLQLTRNFRSVPGVVDWVNAVFGDLIGEGDPGRQPRFESLEPDRQPHHDDRFHPPVVVLGLDPTDDGDAADVRRRSAAEITTCIQRVVDDGWPVGERGEPAHFSDVTVLVPTRTSVPALERALEDAAIPYRLEAMSLVYSSAEVRDLMAVLRAVDDPTDEVSVVAALRSASMGCGDDDLLAFKEARGQWDYRADPPQMLGDTRIRW